MTDLQFDADQEYRPTYRPAGPTGISSLVIQWGLARDHRSAQKVLLGIVIVATVAAFVAPSLFGTSTAQPVSAPAVPADYHPPHF